MLDLNKYTQLCTKSKKKDKQTSKLKKEMIKYTNILLDSNQHLLNAKDTRLSTRLSGKFDTLLFRLVIVQQSKSHFLRKVPKTE